MPRKTPELQREFQRNWMANRRAYWIASKGGVCVKCGSDDRLEIDHIDRTLKTLNFSSIWSRSKEIQDREPANAQLLCYECHKIKTRSERVDPNLQHGTTGMYKRKCRCQICRDADAARCRRQRAAKKEREASEFNL